MKGFIVDSGYELIEDQTIIRLFGRLENKQSFVALKKIDPYFYIKEKDLKKTGELIKKFTIEKTDKKDFSGEKVIKIKNKSHLEINKLSQAIHKLNINTYEADVKPVQRFLIDNDILGTIEIEGE
jgi:DNA polymerase elongation subunit (family B)